MGASEKSKYRSQFVSCVMIKSTFMISLVLSDKVVSRSLRFSGPKCISSSTILNGSYRKCRRLVVLTVYEENNYDYLLSESKGL